MTIYPAAWAILMKIWKKHEIDWSEVEEIFGPESQTRIRLLTARDRYGQRRYKALGKTSSGRLLTIVYILEHKDCIKVITARTMDNKEKREYRERRKT